MTRLRMTKNRVRLAVLVLGVLLFVYCVGYMLCRRSSAIVHRASCAGGEYSSHDVIAGDAKIVSFNSELEALYTPLRYLEIVYWRLKKPIGSPCL